MMKKKQQQSKDNCQKKQMNWPYGHVCTDRKSSDVALVLAAWLRRGLQGNGQVNPGKARTMRIPRLGHGNEIQNLV